MTDYFYRSPSKSRIISPVRDIEFASPLYRRPYLSPRKYYNEPLSYSEYIPI